MLQTSGITILQGSNFSGYFRAKGDDGLFMDLHGWTGRSYLRYIYSSGVLFNFGTPVLTYPSGINLTIPATGTAALPIALAVYDIEIISGSDVHRVFAGRATISPEATY